MVEGIIYLEFTTHQGLLGSLGGSSSPKGGLHPSRKCVPYFPPWRIQRQVWKGSSLIRLANAWQPFLMHKPRACVYSLH